MLLLKLVQYLAQPRKPERRRIAFAIRLERCVNSFAIQIYEYGHDCRHYPLLPAPKKDTKNTIFFSVFGRHSKSTNCEKRFTCFGCCTLIECKIALSFTMRKLMRPIICVVVAVARFVSRFAPRPNDFSTFKTNGPSTKLLRTAKYSGIGVTRTFP